MSHNKHPAYKWPWPKVRLAILERDNRTCRIVGPGCTNIATEVDHIIPIDKGGAWYDPDNLRASCHRCNNHRIDRTRNDRWRNAGTHIVLVTGPPSAGKGTYVREHATPSDMVVDYNTISQSLNNPPPAVVNTARNAILRSLRAGTTGARRAWITSSRSDAETKFPFHEIILIDPGLGECIARARSERRPPDYMLAIQAWYGEREPSTLAESSRKW
jgi:HNH endonuclease